MNKSILFLLLFTVLAVGCRKEKAEAVFPDGEGNCEVAFQVKPDYTLHNMVLTRAGEDETLSGYSVRLENTRAEVLREWKYEEVPALLKMVPGAYKLVAWQGTDTIYPAFERPYYYGETKITLEDGDVLDTVVNVGLAGVKVAVAFDESFAFEYEDYFVEVKTTGDSLRFLKDETRVGYFKPGSLRLRFGLKLRGEDVYREFYPDAIGKVAAKTFCKMKLSAECKNGVLSQIKVTTDATTINIPVKEELPAIFLPKGAPKVALSGVETGGMLETTEGVSRSATVLVTAAGGLTEFKVKTVSDTLLARGWPAEVDLMNATEGQKEILKANGLQWSEELDGASVVKAPVWVKFDEVVKRLNTATGMTSETQFAIATKDRFDQAGDEVNFGVQVAPPVFEFVGEPGEGNVWAKRAVYDVRYVSERERPVVECMGADGQWRALETTLADKGADEYECLGKGLTPSTDYAFRVRLGRHVLDAGRYVTEAEVQVPNSGFEEWHLETQKNWLGQKTYIYHACAESESSSWWATNNVRSTWWTTAPVDYNSAPAVSYLNERGGIVAEIRSTGSGSGYANTAITCYEGSRIPGMLFIGDYHYDKPNETINYGRPFASRPHRLKFWYHYTAFKNEEFEAYIEVQNREGAEIKVIGSGILNSSVGTSDYMLADVALNYSDFSLRATHIFIRFLSSKAVHPEVEKTTINLLGIKNDWGAYVGSRLKIDDIELIYE